MADRRNLVRDTVLFAVLAAPVVVGMLGTPGPEEPRTQALGPAGLAPAVGSRAGRPRRRRPSDC